MPITITPTTEINEASNNYANSQITLSAPGCFYAYPVGAPYPNSHALQVKFPEFNVLPQYSGYINWIFQVAIEANGGVDWVNINGSQVLAQTLGTAMNSTYTKNIIFGINHLALLSPGVYQKTARIRVVATQQSTFVEEVIAERIYPFSIVVTAAIEPFLYVTYFENEIGALAYTYMVGGSGFTPQSVYVYSNGNFEYELSNESGLFTSDIYTLSGYKRIEIGFASPDQEPVPGVVEETLTIIPENEGDPIIIPVKVYVQAATAFPVLSAYPANLEFTRIRGANLPAPQVLSVLSSNNWVVDNQLPVWLSMDKVTGAGIDTIIVKIRESGLSVGVYSHVIRLSNGFTSLNVPVTLNVINFLTSPYRSANGFVTQPLYFTEEPDKLVFASQEEDTYVKLDVSIKIFGINSTQQYIYTRTFKLPFFEGKAEFYLGSVVHQLFEEYKGYESAISEFEINHFTTRIKPAEISLSYAERNIGDDSVIKSGEVLGFRMIKGLAPYMSDDQFGLLDTIQQDVSRVTRNSMICCNFSSLMNTAVVVRKNGVVKDTFHIVPAGYVNTSIFSYIRVNEDVVSGDVIEIAIKAGGRSRTKRYLVLPEGKESTFILFENNNGIVEPFEFTGRRRMPSEYTHTTRKVYKDLYEREEKIKAVAGHSLIVNTGYVLPNDHKVIDAIIKSPKVWCAFDDLSGPYFQVDCVSSKITNKDTDVTEIAFDVEFKILENPNAFIRLQ